jgi:hypothetical protein
LEAGNLDWGVGVMKEGVDGFCDKDSLLTQVVGDSCVGVSVEDMRVLLRVAVVCPSVLRKVCRLATGLKDFSGDRVAVAGLVGEALFGEQGALVVVDTSGSATSVDGEEEWGGESGEEVGVEGTGAVSALMVRAMEARWEERFSRLEGRMRKRLADVEGELCTALEGRCQELWSGLEGSTSRVDRLSGVVDGLCSKDVVDRDGLNVELDEFEARVKDLVAGSGRQGSGGGSDGKSVSMKGGVSMGADQGKVVEVARPGDLEWKVDRNRREYEAWYEVLVGLDAGEDVRRKVRKRMAVMVTADYAGWETTLKAFDMVEEKEVVGLVSEFEDEMKAAFAMKDVKMKEGAKKGKSELPKKKGGWDSVPDTVFQSAPPVAGTWGGGGRQQYGGSVSGRGFGQAGRGQVGFRQGGGFVGSCFNCQQEGHSSTFCPHPPQPRRCFLCGESGHLANMCQRKGGTYNGGQFMGRCFACQQPGHRAGECPAKSAGQQQWSAFGPSLPLQGSGNGPAQPPMQGGVGTA